MSRMEKINAKMKAQKGAVEIAFEGRKVSEHLLRSVFFKKKEIKEIFIQQDEVNGTPLFCEILIDEPNACDDCSERNYGDYNSQTCGCDDTRFVIVTLRIISVINILLPQESIYEMRILNNEIPISRGEYFQFDLKYCLNSAECCAIFSIQDSIDDYTENPTKEMVVIHLSKNDKYRINAVNFDSKILHKYECAAETLIQIILNQQIAQFENENPHIGMKRKKVK